MKQNSPWVFLPLAGFILLAVLLASGLGRNPDELPSALANKPVPAFVLPSLLTANDVNEQVFSGQWTLLNVWATWCPTCHVEHPYLMALARQGVRLVGINYKDDAEKARSYLANAGNPFVEVIQDVDGQLGLDLGVYGAPETFLISADGHVLIRHSGEMNARVWEQKFAPLVATATQPNETMEAP